MRAAMRVVAVTALVGALGFAPLMSPPAQSIPIILGCLDNFAEIAANEAAGKYVYSGYDGHCITIPERNQARSRFVPRQAVPARVIAGQAPAARPIGQLRMVVELSDGNGGWRKLKNNEKVTLPGEIRMRVESASSEVTWGSNNGITRGCQGVTCSGITLPVGVTTVTAAVGGQEVAQRFTVPERVAVAEK